MQQGRLSTSKSASETANQTRKRSKLNFCEPRSRSSKCRIAQNTRTIRPKHSVLAAIFSVATNSQLSSEQRTTNLSALRRKHKTHCKPKLPRVANLLKLFVMRFFGNAKLANENITLNTKNHKRADDFLWFKNQRIQHFVKRPPQARNAAIKRRFSFCL